MNANEWITAFAAALGVEAPSADDIEALLDLAAVAAHSSERIAAPLACFLAGQAGVSVAEARRVADSIGS
jgi:hypothetical protein